MSPGLQQDAFGLARLLIGATKRTMVVAFGDARYRGVSAIATGRKRTTGSLAIDVENSIVEGAAQQQKEGSLNGWNRNWAGVLRVEQWVVQSLPERQCQMGTPH